MIHRRSIFEKIKIMTNLVPNQFLNAGYEVKIGKVQEKRETGIISKINSNYIG